MSKNIFFKSILFSFFLLLCSILFLPRDVSAAPENAKNTTLDLSEEEQTYRDQAGEITIGCSVDNCPLLFQDEETGQMKGITIDILDLVSEMTGLTFRYRALPSGDITYQNLKRLKVDLVAGVESNEINQHASGIALTDTYLHAEKVFVCKKGVIFHPDGEMTIAIAGGSQTLAKIIKQQYPEFQILQYSSTEGALSALHSGKADAVLQNQYTIERILCKPIYEDLQIVATASIGDRQCLGCLVPIDENGQNLIPDDMSLLLSILNKGISRLDQDQVSFIIIKETAENAYQFTMRDTIYRYRFAMIFLFISVMLILVLLRRIHHLNKKRSEQIATQHRAKELAAINTRMKEQQLLLMDSLKRAEEANHAKTSFLFNMSHDIRTPMNAILGFTEIARHNQDNPDKLTDCLEKIQVSGKHLLQLINDVLDMTKIESGKVTLTENCCNLEECITMVQSNLQEDIDKKHLTFQSDMSDTKNKWVYCDTLRVNQILFNLLSNAVKFSKPDGSVLITVSQSPCAIPEYAAYEIRVADNGIGMSPEFLSRIFEPFEREHTSTVSQILGTGLGMSITKNLVDLMDGTIEVFSEPDKGTEFVLHFTFKLMEQTHQPDEQSSSEPVSSYDFSDFTGKRLLLVEDNELNMEIAQELLCEAGFLVETAQNGQIAVEMIRNSEPGYYDAVLMDIQMPVMDGYQASREIRSLEDKVLAKIPIIALTANAFDEDKKEALANGMNAHIAKPLDVGVLYETLGDIIK